MASLLSDAPFPRCPVCLEVITEPVVLPCGHEICKDCFGMTLRVATVCCPLCRKRMSSWARKNAKDPVNRNRKAEIELNKQKLQAEGSSFVDSEVFVPEGLSQPGDIREEYLLELQKVEEEKREDTRRGQDEAERLQREEMRLLEQIKIKEESCEVEDRRLAHSILVEEQQLEESLVQQMNEDEDMARCLLKEYQTQQLVRSPKSTAVEKKPVKQLQKKINNSVPCKPLTHWFKPVSLHDSCHQ